MPGPRTARPPASCWRAAGRRARAGRAARAGPGSWPARPAPAAPARPGSHPPSGSGRGCSSTAPARPSGCDTPARRSPTASRPPAPCTWSPGRPKPTWPARPAASWPPEPGGSPTPAAPRSCSATTSRPAWPSAASRKRPGRWPRRPVAVVTKKKPRPRWPAWRRQQQALLAGAGYETAYYGGPTGSFPSRARSPGRPRGKPAERLTLTGSLTRAASACSENSSPQVRPPAGLLLSARRRPTGPLYLSFPSSPGGTSFGRPGPPGQSGNWRLQSVRLSSTKTVYKRIPTGCPDRRESHGTPFPVPPGACPERAVGVAVPERLHALILVVTGGRQRVPGTRHCLVIMKRVSLGLQPSCCLREETTA